MEIQILSTTGSQVKQGLVNVLESPKLQGNIFNFLQTLHNKSPVRPLLFNKYHEKSIHLWITFKNNIGGLIKKGELIQKLKNYIFATFDQIIHVYAFNGR